MDKKESVSLFFSCHKKCITRGKRDENIYIWSGRTTTERDIQEDTIYEYTYINEEKEIEKK